MASLLFANVAEEFAARKTDDTVELSSQVSELFDVIDDTEGRDISIKEGEKPQAVFISTVANEYYQKSIEDINNTTVGNKAVRRKNFQQIMKESFFYGANRFGNNFIA